MTEVFKVLFTYEQDPETGDIKCIDRQVVNDDIKVAKPKKAKSSKAKKEENTTPQLTLEENKYFLNSAAAELMGVEPDDRIDIKFEKAGKGRIPVIGKDESFGTKGGNRLTKSMSVSYRGKNNDELSIYGDVFTITPHDDPSKEGIFVLSGNKQSNSVEVKDDNIQLPEDTELPTDLNLDDVLDGDDEVKEVDSLNFTL